MALVLIRSTILYFIVIGAFRFMGKRQVGELQPSELVVAMMMSDLATVPMQSTEIPLIYGIIPILALMCYEVLIAYMSAAKPKIRQFFAGKPVIIASNGKIDQKVVSNLRISIDDIYQEMRQQNVTHLSDVKYMIAETSGNMSVLPISQNNFVSGYERPVIKCGSIDKNAASFFGLSNTDIENILKNNAIKKIDDVFILSIDDSGKTNITLKEKKR